MPPRGTKILLLGLGPMVPSSDKENAEKKRAMEAMWKAAIFAPSKAFEMGQTIGKKEGTKRAVASLLPSIISKVIQ